MRFFVWCACRGCDGLLLRGVLHELVDCRLHVGGHCVERLTRILEVVGERLRRSIFSLGLSNRVRGGRCSPQQDLGQFE